MSRSRCRLNRLAALRRLGGIKQRAARVAGLFLVAQIFLDFMPNPAAETCADTRSDWTADRGADDAPYGAADSCSNELGLVAFLFVRHDAPLYVD
jgi:hypothetical protein